MTMMVHVRRVVAALPKAQGFTGTLYFGGFEKQFDKAELSDDQEVLITSYKGGAKLCIRIASIDAIEMPESR